MAFYHLEDVITDVCQLFLNLRQTATTALATDTKVDGISEKEGNGSY